MLPRSTAGRVRSSVCLSSARIGATGVGGCLYRRCCVADRSGVATRRCSTASKRPLCAVICARACTANSGITQWRVQDPQRRKDVVPQIRQRYLAPLARPLRVLPRQTSLSCACCAAGRHDHSRYAGDRGSASAARRPRHCRRRCRCSNTRCSCAALIASVLSQLIACTEPP
jgi:hypothetical protein